MEAMKVQEETDAESSRFSTKISNATPTTQHREGQGSWHKTNRSIIQPMEALETRTMAAMEGSILTMGK
ncbi:hypothetical protein TSUD_259340 [Trifolium subterraneum]|uniref:Uncharacterized protein n=1 Tax=Trifolium subterraneum TaxID=3900 RepID=A0A2Z6MQJ3_TRISU|nr:hypothetical protein TSUD_259340 [Trifolium subterraneum]